MILIITNRTDQTADWLILELEGRGTPYVRFNTEDFPAATSLEWTSEGTERLQWRDTSVDLAAVTAVLYRRPLPPDPSSWSTPERGRWALGESRAALEGVWRTLDALWVNHPDDNRAAGSKLSQLRRAREIGFIVPSTLVTNDAAVVRTFAGACSAAGLVCKPLEEGLLELAGEERLFFTSPLEIASDDALEDLGPEPYLFQQFIPKLYDVRVTVIGDEVFATRIESQATEKGKTDWRRAGAEAVHTPENLPVDLAALCVALTRSYRLNFAAIDLAYTPDGYSFFEINPNGQWAWIEQLTEQPLRSSMADLLERGAP